jgi:predicted AAA+ superfamily ATPase
VQRIKSPKKVYVIDNGFVSAKAIQHSPDKGKLLENLVFTELVKQGVKPNRELFYYKTRNDREVDFVLKKGTEVVELLQVAYGVHNRDVEQREIKALTEASQELGVSDVTILTWDDEREMEQGGKVIKCEPVWKWLLGQTKV